MCFYYSKLPDHYNGTQALFGSSTSFTHHRSSCLFRHSGPSLYPTRTRIH